jgi:hypothetical protein
LENFTDGWDTFTQDILPVDFLVLPNNLLHNLTIMPKLFRMIYPESYYCQDIDLNMQLGGIMAMILNRRFENPHVRVEFIDFILHLIP